MEQERIKKAEKEKAEKEKAEKLAKAKLNSDTDLKDDVSNPVLVKSKFVSINYYDLFFHLLILNSKQFSMTNLLSKFFK